MSLSTKLVKFMIGVVTIISAFTPIVSHAQKDPEAAARQARIDADQASSKIQELQQDQAAAADVQDETTTEMAARSRQIGDVEAQEMEAERRLRQAERSEQ